METKRIMAFLGMTIAVAFGIHAEYSLKINRGKYPADVRIENLNGNLPLTSWYKNGWTDQGWTSDNYGTSYYVALSPSVLTEGEVCENALTLPSMKIEDGEWLSWVGCEVYPLFRDRYTVEFRLNGSESWITLGDYTESKSTWSHRMIDLSPYHGTEGEIRFVCRSSEGYMLALDSISILKPTAHTFALSNHTPKFFAIGELQDGNAITEVSVMNTGAAMSEATISLSTGGNSVASIHEGNPWPTGETRTFRLPLPLTPNVRTDYNITIEPSDGEILTIGESFAYCTSFKRHLFVDKGTGMWCNNCPTGTLTIEQLEETYGDALIVGETHNGDPLANDMYFSWLKFYGIPYLMLNHIQSTKGENASRFEDQICVPTEMEVDINDLTLNTDGTLSASASVSTSDSFSDTGRTYRIGYLLTRNVRGDENKDYYQKNICTLAKDKQYRYLPSKMVYSMCSFPDVTIPSQLATSSENPGFTGISGSLPDLLASGETYHSEWNIPLPEGFDSFDGMRLVAFIIDADNRYIINSTSVYIDDLAGVEAIGSVGSESGVKQIYTIDGRPVRGEASSLRPGLYVIDGKKVLIK